MPGLNCKSLGQHSTDQYEESCDVQECTPGIEIRQLGSGGQREHVGTTRSPRNHCCTKIHSRLVQTHELRLKKQSKKKKSLAEYG